MNPLLLTVPLLLLQAPQTPLPEVEAKDLPQAPRGPMVPRVPDAGAEHGTFGQVAGQPHDLLLIRDDAVGLFEHRLHLRQFVFDLDAPVLSVDVIVHNAAAQRPWPIQRVELYARILEKKLNDASGGGKVEVLNMGVNGWGREEPGLLQNRIATGEPQATYKNPGQETRTIYFIVDTLDAGMVGEAFTLEITRS